MDYTNLLEQADLFLVHSYRKNHNPQLYFHTIESVRDIVNAVMTLSEKYALTAEDRFVVADAVSFHLGSKSFVDLKQRMYLEVNYRKNQVIDERIWYALTLVFLRNHTYFTEEARLLKEGIKKNNIAYFVKLQIAGKQSSV